MGIPFPGTSQAKSGLIYTWMMLLNSSLGVGPNLLGSHELSAWGGTNRVTGWPVLLRSRLRFKPPDLPGWAPCTGNAISGGLPEAGLIVGIPFPGTSQAQGGLIYTWMMLLNRSFGLGPNIMCFAI